MGLTLLRLPRLSLMDGGAEARHKLEAEELGIIKFVGGRRLFYCQRVLTLSQHGKL